MTDGAGSKKPSIPDWQISPPDQASDTSSKTAKDAGREIPVPDRDALVDQARIFLEDESVRDSPRDKKIAFLEKKGLGDDEIQKLLKTASPAPTTSAVQDSSLTTVHESSTSSSSASSTSSNQHPSISSSSQATPASQTSRDIPPIITYPEFLLHPAKPPPLITFDRLSYSLYTLASISALTYGASRYLIQPMLQSLTSSRHDLASSALANLARFNARLESNVSHIPSVISPKRAENDHGHDRDSDVETIDSDPTELFHRDIATQTSPRLLASPLVSRASSSCASHPKARDDDATTTQSTRLTTLATSLSSFLTAESSTQSALLDTLSDCQSYLHKLQFSMNSYADYNAPKEDEAGEAMRFRQEIRSVKGALLSIRNFPVGRPATNPGGGGSREVVGRR